MAEDDPTFAAPLASFQTPAAPSPLATSTLFIPLSLVDAKGDLLVGTSNDVMSRLAVSATDGMLFVSDSSQATGVKWGGVGYGTSLPAAPVDTLEYILVDSLTLPTYQWRFRYNAGSANTDKWDFVGGPPSLSEVATTETTASTTYVALATGQTLVLPRAGVYQISVGAQAFLSSFTVNSTEHFWASYDNGGSAAIDGDAGYGTASGGFQTAGFQIPSGSTLLKTSRKTIAASPTTLTCKFKVTSGTGTFLNRWISATPVRVS